MLCGRRFNVFCTLWTSDELQNNVVCFLGRFVIYFNFILTFMNFFLRINFMLKTCVCRTFFKTFQVSQSLEENGYSFVLVLKWSKF